MSLGSALNTARTGLAAQQVAVEVAGNNLANLATEGFHRRSVVLEPIRSREIQSGLFVGRGVQTQAIVRQVDNALEARIRSNISDRSASLARRDLLAQIESLQNEFSDADMSSHLNTLFGAFGELANNPQDTSLRTLVVREASNLTHFVDNLRAELTKLRTQVDGSIYAAATAANDLLIQIEQVNAEIIKNGGANGGAPDLRDQRDGLLSRLSEFIDISVNEQESGSIDIFVGSQPIMLGAKNRGIAVRRQTADAALQLDLVVASGGSLLHTTSGSLGSLFDAREIDVNSALKQIDDFIHSLIFEVNRVHSQGQGLSGFDAVTATNRVSDPLAALNDASVVDFIPEHGSFLFYVTQKSTGQRTSNMISVDLDGIAAAADTTLTSLTADIDAVANVSATITPDGRLSIESDGNDFEFSFSDDSSGVLAALGINGFFTGRNAGDIAVDSRFDARPSAVAAALDHLAGDNRNARALAQLKDQPIRDLDGLSIIQAWNRHVEDYAVRFGQTDQQLEAESLVGDNLIAQQQSVSGVNADEEAINLLAFQRAYQGSARFLQVVDELLETLISLV